MEILQKTREEHAFKNVWMQDERIIYWDAVSDRVIVHTKRSGRFQN